MWLRLALALALVNAALASLDIDKRAEMAPAPFVLGSRYGRSPPAPPRPRAPRNDRFFMGSRYGKRSEPALSQPRSVADRQVALRVLADRQVALRALADRQVALRALADRQVARHSPSLLWQAAALLAARSHRTVDVAS